ncbi:hypothetical protein LOTGIDRAFT_228966 [Lottia gigantea]|uniref:PDZ domain-containing protein n=1 Tax=Lottia gigantea TaxID=225164 RepID=V3ZD46_LOTGI|nr:hypothetical protein LOTGIDRAFT_228966 [Lottia gigantea]ESO89028.1 hypothetical protein LOTGIDRAFT_228966 [Lottia gigantea]
MGTGNRRRLTLTGGAPWGFRLQGGGNSQLKVSKIRKKSQAHTSGLQEGDSLLTINGVSAQGKSHEEAMELIDSGGVTLVLEVCSGNLSQMEVVPQPSASYINGFVPPSQQSYFPSSSSLQSISRTNVQTYVPVPVPTESLRARETNSFMRQEQTPNFSPKPWNSTLYQNQVAKPFGSPSYSPAPQVQVSAMYNSNAVKENIPPPPRRLSLQPYSERSPRYSPRSISPHSPASGVDRMPTLNVWQLKDMPKYQRPAPPPKRAHEAPPAVPMVKMPPPVAPKPKPAPPPPPPPQLRPEDHPHIYAPPVEICLDKPEPKLSDSGYFGSPFGYRPHNLALQRTFSLESDISNTSSALGHKKHYGDSAFYNDPEKNFPTIEEQMKLCKAIALSLTSAANKKARGARMFAKRQKKSPNWIHDELTCKQSSAGGNDVANLLDLDSELSWADGGSKPLFSFRVPANLKNRINSPESTPKMSLSKDEFEKLRLQSQKNEHQNVSPNQCFDLVANLKSGKGRGAKLFEKRQKKAEKWVIDESNAKKTSPVTPVNRLDSMLMSPPKPYTSPWEAASKGHDVNAAFEHLSEFEKQQRLNQILGYTPPKAQQPVPVTQHQPIVITPVSHTSLKTDQATSLLEGHNFNRVAKGWGAPSSQSVSMPQQQQQQVYQQPPPPEPKQQQQSVQLRDYNPKPKAWRGSQYMEEDESSPEPMFESPSPAIWTPSNNSPHDSNMFSPNYSAYSGSGQPSPNYYGHNNVGMYSNGYGSHPVELPGSDL